MGPNNFFGYGSILISFSLERIPLLHRQHISLELLDPNAPWMRRWVDLMSRHAGPSSMSFTPVLFRWLSMQFNMIDDYPYVGFKFREDIDRVLPKSGQWGDIGKTQ